MDLMTIAAAKALAGGGGVSSVNGQTGDVTVREVPASESGGQVLVSTGYDGDGAWAEPSDVFAAFEPMTFPAESAAMFHQLIQSMEASAAQAAGAPVTLYVDTGELGADLIEGSFLALAEGRVPIWSIGSLFFRAVQSGRMQTAQEDEGLSVQDISASFSLSEEDNGTVTLYSFTVVGSNAPTPGRFVIRCTAYTAAAMQPAGGEEEPT